MLNVFIGYDPRQPVAYQVLAHSIWKRATKPVSITRLQLDQLPVQRKGLTEFTFSRYLVPHLLGYQGEGLFLDADMLVLADIHELAAYARALSYDAKMNKFVSVCIVKAKQRFEWPSLMWFNADMCKRLTPHYVEHGKPQTFEWANGPVGELPPEWNHCVGYDEPRDDAKIVHYTQGVPCWRETWNCEYGEAWRREASETMSTVSWEALMGHSVHAPRVKAAQHTHARAEQLQRAAAEN